MSDRAVAIVVVYHHIQDPVRLGYLSDCLRAIRDQGRPGGIDVVLVNNVHPELSARQAWDAAFGAGADLGGLRLLELDLERPVPVIPAKSAGLRHALERSEAPYVGFLDFNSVAAPGWLEHLIEAFEAPDRVWPPGRPVGAVGGVVHGLGQPERLVSLGHHQVQGATRDLGYGEGTDRLGELTSEDAWRRTRPFAPCLCASLFSRDCLEAIQRGQGAQGPLLADALEHYYGCTDMGLKVQAAGYAYGFSAQAVCGKEKLRRDKAKSESRRLREASNRLTITRAHYAPGPVRDQAEQAALDAIGDRPADEARAILERADRIRDSVAESRGGLPAIGQELEPAAPLAGAALRLEEGAQA